MPAISIIVPVYNVEKHLHKCIDSILNQTFTDFELILVDDGSPDNCPAICDEYAKQDTRIKVIHKNNGGLSSARNAGIKNATGKYIMFCDSDDTVDPDWCRMMYDCIKAHPNAWIVCNMWKVTNDKKTMCHNGAICNKDILTYFDIFNIGLSPYAPNKIYLLDKLKTNNIFFDDNCRYGEDVEFNVNYCSLCDEIIYIQSPLYFYYENPNGIMNTYRYNLFALNLNMFNARLRLISKENLSDYCDIYLYMFLQWLDNTMDKRNKMSFIAKMRYNHKMMNTDEFKYCVEHASGEKESPLFMKVVRKHNYYLYWLFQKATNFKQKFRKK